jgi:hypothetical protein
MQSEGAISIWFFIGISLVVNGLLIFGAGLYEIWHPPAQRVVLFFLHANVWWGALLVIGGGMYCYFFTPGRRRG